MTEPNRWLKDGAPKEVARLLEAARREQPAPAGLQRTLVGLGIGASAAGIAGKSAALSAAGASVSKAAVVSAIKWGAVGLVATLSTVGAVRLVQRANEPASSGQNLHSRPTATVVVSPAQPPPSSEPMLQPPAEQPPAVRETPRPAPGSPALRAPEPAAEAPIDADKLAEQVKVVDRARAALAQGRPVETLAILNDYESGFSERRFGPEALYLRMEALLATGEHESARKVAERLLALAPKGPHSARARVILGQTNP